MYLYIILGYIIGLIILNKNIVQVYTAEWKFTEFIDETRYHVHCLSYKEISCVCDEDIYCNVNDQFGDIYVNTGLENKQIVMVCPKKTKLDIDRSILEHSIFIQQPSHSKQKKCKDLSDSAFHGFSGRLILNMKEINKLTVIYNDDIKEQRNVSFSVKSIIHHQIILRSSRDIINVPHYIFSTHFKLKTFTLSVQRLLNQPIALKNLRQDHFKKFTALRQLDLAGNNMKTLEENIFATLGQLNCLNLSRNEIGELQPKLFVNQRQLLILDLSYNLLTYLSPELFTETLWLWQLKLNGNRLHDTTNLIGNLQPLHYIHGLDLSENKLQTVWGTEIYSNASVALLSNFNVNIPMALEQDLNYILKLRSENCEVSKLNITVIDLSRNLLSEFNLDWLINAGIACPFQINLEHNLIKNIYALSNLLTTSADCEREIKMAGNPVVCDCKLAWIYHDNFHTLFSGLHCNQTSTKILTDLAKRERKDLCDWQPILCPSNCDCYTQSELLIINCNGRRPDIIEQLPRPEQVTLTSSILDISNNKLTVLPLNTTFGYANVSQLYASNNKITNISIFQLPTNLTGLDLRNNRLKSLNAEVLRTLLNDSSKLQFLYLSENLWFCDCAAQHLMYTVRANRKRIPDVEQLHCVNLRDVTLLTANVDELCQYGVNIERYQYMIATVTTPALIVIISLLIFALYYKYQTEVKVWLYGHNILSCCIHELELDKNKTFDAFISYAHQDADFVNHTLLPQLEECEQPFRICTHERNWLAGAYITEQIIESVDQSRRTIIVLSQHFIESDWARMEFRTAHQCSLKEGRARIILIKYGELTNTELLDKELKAYLDMNTYLNWQDPRFWDKLRYAMPHKLGRERNADMLDVGGRMYVMGQVEMNRLRDESA